MTEEQKVILTRGLPGSGKTTWAKEWVNQDPENRIRVNRDDIRNMLYGTYQGLSQDQENFVTRIERASVREGISKGKSVVIDAMHLKMSYVKEWQRVYPIEVREFDASMDVLLQRNALRDKKVPISVLQNLSKRFYFKGGLKPLRFDNLHSFTSFKQVLETDWERKVSFLVDIDGTIAHMDDRRSPHDYSKVGLDRIDLPVAAMISTLRDSPDTEAIIFMSGRPDSCRKETEEWLKYFEIPYDELFMRKTGDNRDDTVVKYEMYKEHVEGKYNVAVAFDDRSRVVRLWRSLGISCFQVQDGDF